MPIVSFLQQVIFLAVFLSLIFKKPNMEDEDEDTNEEPYKLLDDEEWLEETKFSGMCLQVNNLYLIQKCKYTYVT